MKRPTLKTLKRARVYGRIGFLASYGCYAYGLAADEPMSWVIWNAVLWSVNLWLLFILRGCIEREERRLCPCCGVKEEDAEEVGRLYDIPPSALKCRCSCEEEEQDD